MSSHRFTISPNTDGDSALSSMEGDRHYRLRSSPNRKESIETYVSTHTPAKKANLVVILSDDADTASVRQTGNNSGRPTIIKIPTREIEQRTTDIDREVFDKEIQYAWSIHEAGHILYTDQGTVNAYFQNTDLHRLLGELHKDTWNAAEDAAIEEALRADKGENVAERLAIKNQNFINRLDDVDEEASRNIHIDQAILSAAIDLGKCNTGFVDRILDEDNDTWQFASETDEELFLELLPSLREMLADVQTIGDAEQRTGRIFEYLKEQDELLREEYNLDEIPEHDREQFKGDDGDDTENNSGSAQQQASQLQQNSPEQMQQRQEKASQQVTKVVQKQQQEQDGDEGDGDSSQQASGAEQESADGDSDADSDSAAGGDPEQGDDDQDADAGAAGDDADGEDGADAGGEQADGDDGDQDGDAAGAGDSGDEDGDDAGASGASGAGDDEAGDGADADEGGSQAAAGGEDSDGEDGDEDGEQGGASGADGDSESGDEADAGDDAGGSAGGDDGEDGEAAGDDDSDAAGGDGGDAGEDDADADSEAGGGSEAGDDESDAGSDGRTQKSLNEFLGGDDAGDESGDSDGEGDSESGDEADTGDGDDAESGAEDSDAGNEGEGDDTAGAGDEDGGESPDEAGDGDDAGSVGQDGDDADGDADGADDGDTGDTSGDEDGDGDVGSDDEGDGDSSSGGDEEAGGAEDDDGDEEAGGTAGDDDGDDDEAGEVEDPTQPPDVGDDYEPDEEHVQQSKNRLGNEKRDQQAEENQLKQELENLAEALSGDGDGGGNGAGAGDITEIEFNIDDKETYSEQRWNAAVNESNGVTQLLKQRLEMEQRDEWNNGMTAGKPDSTRMHGVKTGSVNVMRRIEEGEQKDYSVVIVLDRSGSMRDRIETAEKSVVAFAKGLEDLGIDVCIIDMHEDEARLVSPFNQELQRAKERLMTSETGGGTPLHDPLNIARRRLELERGATFVLSVTDGEPHDEEAYREELRQSMMPVMGLTLAFDHSEGNVPEELDDQATYYDTHAFVHSPTDLSNALERITYDIAF